MTHLKSTPARPAMTLAFTVRIWLFAPESVKLPVDVIAVVEVP